MNVVLSKIQDIFREIFDDDSIVLTRETSRDDIEGWDSITQVNIIVACESDFGVKFNLDDIPNLKTVGLIADTVERKLNK